MDVGEESTTAAENEPNTSAENEPNTAAQNEPNTATENEPNAETTAELEPWMTFERDVTVWRQTLEEWGCDESAIKTVFLLAQHSSAGYEAANGVVAKLLKKKANAIEVRNPSAFIHSCAQKARHVLESSLYNTSIALEADCGGESATEPSSSSHVGPIPAFRKRARDY